jgi:hypothetical protein
MAVAALFMQLSGIALAQIFPPLIVSFRESFGNEAGVFWIYCACCLAAFAFSYYLVPETKGRTLEQIAEWWLPKGKETA